MRLCCVSGCVRLLSRAVTSESSRAGSSSTRCSGRGVNSVASAPDQWLDSPSSRLCGSRGIAPVDWLTAAWLRRREHAVRSGGAVASDVSLVMPRCLACATTPLRFQADCVTDLRICGSACMNQIRAGRFTTVTKKVDDEVLDEHVALELEVLLYR